MLEGVVDSMLVVEDSIVLDDVSLVVSTVVEEGVDDVVVVDSRLVDDLVVDELVVVGSEVMVVEELMVDFDVDVAADEVDGISVELVMVVEGVVLVVVLDVDVTESFLIPFLIPIIETATPVSASFTRAPKIPS